MIYSCLLKLAMNEKDYTEVIKHIKSTNELLQKNSLDEIRQYVINYCNKHNIYYQDCDNVNILKPVIENNEKILLDNSIPIDNKKKQSKKNNIDPDLLNTISNIFQ